MSKINRYILLLVITLHFGCNKNEVVKTANDEIIKVTGTINKDSSSAPIYSKITPLNAPKKTKAGIPAIIQNPISTGIGKPNFTNYNTEQGLALSGIGCAMKDSKGNLWFGTSGGGVSRYDGKSFCNYTTVHGLANNTIFSLYEDKNRNIWIGTNGGGVSKFNGTSFYTYSTKNGLPNNSVWGIVEDKMHNIWFATDGGGVSCFNGTTFKNYTTEQGLAKNNVWCVTKDKQDNLWFGTNGGGVSKFDGTKFTNYTTEHGLASNTVFSIAIDDNENVWIGTTSQDISCFNGKTFSKYTIPNSLANFGIVNISKDSKGNLWFGTYGNGVTKYDGKSFFTINTNIGLSNNNIFGTTEDNSGNLWFSTYGSGIVKYDGESFTNFNTDIGLANNSVRSVLEDSKGNIWFGTYGSGVSKFDGKTFTNYSDKQGLAKTGVWCIKEDKKGNIWIGTYGGGITSFDGTSFTQYTSKQGLANDNVRYIEQDKKGNLWIATNGGGVSYFDGISFKNYTTAQGLANNNIRSILEDRKGNIWFATYENGLSCFDGKVFSNFTTTQGLPSNSIYCMKEDSTGNIWIGTDGGGLSRYDGKSFTNFSTQDGMPDNSVTQILLYGSNEFIIGTNNGISNLHFESLKNNSSKNKNNSSINISNTELKKNHFPVFKNYNNKTGYFIKDINSGQNSLFFDSKGILWASTGDQKLVRVDLNAINYNKKPLELAIQNIKINNENICWHDINLSKYQNKLNQKADSNYVAPNITEEVTKFGSKLTENMKDTMLAKFGDIEFESISQYYPFPQHLILPYQHNSITFEFAAIEPAMPKQVLYQYILEGYDDHWSPLNNNTTANFGNIYEGNYTFKLKCLSPTGVSSEVSYSFKVLPPYYRTWWAYLCYGCFLFTCIYLLIRQRTAALKIRQKQLEQTVEQRTCELKEEKHLVEEKQKEIIESITYAKRLQDAILPPTDFINKHLLHNFILYKPKDIVAGDFYWAEAIGDLFFIAAADSTGHGVPGAMVSVVCSNALNRTVKEFHLTETGEILDKTRELVLETFEKSTSEVKDGMDISLLCIDYKNKKIFWSGANNPLWYIVNDEMKDIKADKQPIGKTDYPKPFTTHHINFTEDSIFYLFTDGYADQFGGDKGKKFKYQQFSEVLLQNHKLSLQKQSELLNMAFDNWKGDLEQVDDVCVIGIKI
jgi:ligand-binding sensor domain-containing protein/serine phosphatase RsbU (regulator of sigma subunit)